MEKLVVVVMADVVVVMGELEGLVEEKVEVVV